MYWKMTMPDLKTLWKEISYSGRGEFEFVRIDSQSKPEINIGLNSKLHRCLLLELPKNHGIDVPSSAKQNLSLSFFREDGYIVLELTDADFYDLFDDLIGSIYQKIHNLTDVREYSSIFVQMFYRWSEFFEDKSSDSLSGDTIQGLFGEMFVLKNLLIITDSAYVNDLLESWRGPYDQGHDFVLDGRDIEVKTKVSTRSSVKISSEFQLESENERPLELLVLSVERNTADSYPLSKLLFQIKEIVMKKMGDFHIVLKAIGRKNLSTQNIRDYDNYIFEPIKQTAFNPLNEGFPKIVRSEIPKELSGISYTLNLNTLDRFIVSKEIYND
jgi:hypothetical protein